MTSTLMKTAHALIGRLLRHYRRERCEDGSHSASSI